MRGWVLNQVYVDVIVHWLCLIFFLQVLTVVCHLSVLFTCGWKTANLGIVWVHMSFYMFVCLNTFLWNVKCVCNSMYVSWWYTVGKWRGWLCRCPQCLWALLAQACLSIFVTILKFDASHFQLTVSEPWMNELVIYTKCLIKSAAAPGINVVECLGIFTTRE